MIKNDELYHFGVKGMKWGVRNEKTHLPSKSTGRNTLKSLDGLKERLKKSGNTEIAKRGKAALDVLMNGDKDWMDNPIHSDNMATEVRNRGKAAIERMLYSQEQIDNKKFFGRYDF